MGRYAVAVILLVAGLACSAGTQRIAERANENRSGSSIKRTQLVLLGTGTPNADPDRSGPALAIVVNGQAYLVDCGPGVVRRAAGARRAGIDALAPAKLTHVFITHLHSDHTLGYPDLVFSPWVLGRKSPLEAYGPSGLAKMTASLVDAYDEDIRMRVDGLEPANTTGYKVNVHEIEPGMIYEDDNVRVTAFAVQHGSWQQAFGYRFETADRTIVVSGDTAPSANLVLNAIGCDVLVHEVYSQAGFEKIPPQWQRYHASFHTSTTELARIAQKVRPKLLILTHQLFWGASPEDLLTEIGQIYNGQVRSGEDMQVY